jgi:hypothetical protein
MTGRWATHNTGFASGGVTCIADSFVVSESFVLRINICGKIPARTQSPKPLCAILKKKRTKIKPFNENNILPSITIKINKL